MLARFMNSAPRPVQNLTFPPGSAICDQLSTPSPVQKKSPRSTESIESPDAPMTSPPRASGTFTPISNIRQVRANEGGDVDSLLGNLRISLSAVGTITVGHGHGEEIESCHHLSLFCVISGHGQISVGDEIIEAAIGTVILVPRDREVSMQASTKAEADFLVSKAHMAIDLGRGFSFFQTLEGTIVNHDDTTFADLNVLSALEGVLAGSLGAHAIAEALLTVLVIKALCAALAETRCDERLRLTLTHPGIARVLNAITSNPGGAYNVNDLAAIAGLTTQQLAQTFNAIFAQTPANYLKCLRLKLAESLLLETRQPVKTIAGIVGYSSRSHFSRTFREHRGVDPTEYRQMNSA